MNFDTSLNITQLNPIELSVIILYFIQNSCNFPSLTQTYRVDAPIVSLSLGQPLNPNKLMNGSDVYLECDVKANPPIRKVEWFHSVSTPHSGAVSVFCRFSCLVWLNVKVRPTDCPFPRSGSTIAFGARCHHLEPDAGAAGHLEGVPRPVHVSGHECAGRRVQQRRLPGRKV